MYYNVSPAFFVYGAHKQWALQHCHLASISTAAAISPCPPAETGLQEGCQKYCKKYCAYSFIHLIIYLLFFGLFLIPNMMISLELQSFWFLGQHLHHTKLALFAS